MSELNINASSMSGTNSLSSNDGAKQTNKQTNEPSIFMHKDSNNNNIVDAEDFGGNEAVVEIVQRNGWLGKAWDAVGEALNLLLKHVSTDKKDTKSVEDVLNSMVENVDLNNYSEVTAVLTAIGNEASRKGSIGYDSEKRDAYYQKLFKGNFESYDMYRDGGSKEIKLKDGTIIYQNFSMSSPRNERGQFTVTKPDGTVEYYNDEGKPIEK